MTRATPHERCGLEVTHASQYGGDDLQWEFREAADRRRRLKRTRAIWASRYRPRVSLLRATSHRAVITQPDLLYALIEPFLKGRRRGCSKAAGSDSVHSAQPSASMCRKNWSLLQVAMVSPVEES